MRPYVVIRRRRLSDGYELAAYRPYERGRSYERAGWLTEVALCHCRAAAELSCRIINCRL